LVLDFTGVECYGLRRDGNAACTPGLAGQNRLNMAGFGDPGWAGPDRFDVMLE
jgi:hypothetical protein